MLTQPFGTQTRIQHRESLPEIVKLPSVIKKKLCDYVCPHSEVSRSQCLFYKDPISYDARNSHRTNCFRWAGINEIQLLMIKVKYKLDV